MGDGESRHYLNCVVDSLSQRSFAAAHSEDADQQREQEENVIVADPDVVGTVTDEGEKTAEPSRFSGIDHDAVDGGRHHEGPGALGRRYGDETAMLRVARKQKIVAERDRAALL